MVVRALAGQELAELIYRMSKVCNALSVIKVAMVKKYLWLLLLGDLACCVDASS